MHRTVLHICAIGRELDIRAGRDQVRLQTANLIAVGREPRASLQCHQIGPAAWAEAVRPRGVRFISSLPKINLPRWLPFPGDEALAFHGESIRVIWMENKQERRQSF